MKLQPSPSPADIDAQIDEIQAQIDEIQGKENEQRRMPVLSFMSLSMKMGGALLGGPEVTGSSEEELKLNRKRCREFADQTRRLMGDLQKQPHVDVREGDSRAIEDLCQKLHNASLTPSHHG